MTAPRLGDTECHHRPCTISPPGLQFFAARAAGRRLRVNFSGPTQLEVSGFQQSDGVICLQAVHQSTAGCLTLAEQPRVLVPEPPPFPELGCTPRVHGRLFVLHHNLWGLARVPLAQHERSFDVSTPPAQCAWEETEMPLRALLST